MIRHYVSILLIVYLLSDFYLCSSDVNKKESSLTVKSLCFFVLNGIMSLFFWNGELLKITVGLSLMHFLILLVVSCAEKKKKINHSLAFLVENGLCLASVFMTAYWIECCQIELPLPSFLNAVLDAFLIDRTETEKWILATLLLMNPVNALIQNTITKHKPYEKNEEFKKDNQTGRIIGIIERLILLIFLSVDQYSALGLVLTAKSITRYDRISKDKEFAEYYLLGTLVSSLCVLVVKMIVLK